MSLGTLSANSFKLTTDAGYAGTYSTSSINYSVGTQYFNVPFSEVVSAGSAPPIASTGTGAWGPYQATAFRGLMVVADCYFTGPTSANGGTARVYKTSTALTNNTVSSGRDGGTLFIGTYSDIDTGLNSAAGLATHPARSTFAVRAVNNRPEYVDCKYSTATSEIMPAMRNSAGSLLTVDNPWVGLDENVPVTVVSYEGLDSTASITVELRSCIEIAVAPGSFPGLAKSSPPTNMTVWQQVANFARSLPTTEVVKRAGAGLTGYVTGGLPGALAGLLLT